MGRLFLASLQEQQESHARLKFYDLSKLLETSSNTPLVHLVAAVFWLCLDTRTATAATAVVDLKEGDFQEILCDCRPVLCTALVKICDDISSQLPCVHEYPSSSRPAVDLLDDILKPKRP